MRFLGRVENRTVPNKRIRWAGEGGQERESEVVHVQSVWLKESNSSGSKEFSHTLDIATGWLGCPGEPLDKPKRGSTMNLTFVKVGDHGYVTHVVRDDGVKLVSSP